MRLQTSRTCSSVACDCMTTSMDGSPGAVSKLRVYGKLAGAANTDGLWKSLLTSYPPGGVEVFEREEAVGDGRPAGGRAGRPAASRIAASCLLPSVISIWCVR